MKASEKYAEAIELYRTTNLTLTEISRRCGVSRNALAIYIQRNHRDLMFSRHSIDAEIDTSVRLRQNKGQSALTRQKYRDAILACDSKEYLHLNISQIAEHFGLHPSSLANQLANHYPEIKTLREQKRHEKGFKGNNRRGARQTTEKNYAPAVKMLMDCSISVKEAAKKCGVSYSGLRQHILFYHRDLSVRREDEKNKKKGKGSK